MALLLVCISDQASCSQNKENYKTGYSSGLSKLLKFSLLFRSWDKVCVVLKGTKLSFYKDQKSYRSAPDSTFRGEQTIDVVGGKAERAEDYKKKANVFRLR